MSERTCPHGTKQYFFCQQCRPNDPPPTPNPSVRHGPGRDNSGDAILMTTPSKPKDTEALLERLRRVGYLNSDNGDWGPRNPDGPEAADTIEALMRERDAKDEALRDCNIRVPMIADHRNAADMALVAKIRAALTVASEKEKG